MLEGSCAEQIIELVQIGDLSTFVLFPATVNISDENKMENQTFNDVCVPMCWKREGL